jgi:16S rRNA (cytidine1402-2'-O)-methyltransferase
VAERESKRKSKSGGESVVLFIVSTPIGNLGDLSPRAKEVLAEVDCIACEDTRVTRRLLRHFGIRAKLLSYHEHNEERRARELVHRMLEGENIALVSDAGTPGVSDPGYRLVHSARQAGIRVRAVPGPSALLAALAACGLPTSSFLFLGFLPSRGSERRKAIESLCLERHTVVLFESPRRAGRLLLDLAREMPDREAVLMREMTKLHEEHRSGTLAELASWVTAREEPFRGELTIVIKGLQRGDSRLDAPSVDDPSILAPRYHALREEGLSAREAARRLSRESGLSVRQIYSSLAVKKTAEPEPDAV